TANEHTLIDIMGKWFESGGNSKFNPKGGVAQLTAQQAAGELAGGGFQAYHPAALGKPYLSAKQAASLGLSAGAGTTSENNIGSLITQFISQLQTAAQSAVTKLGNVIQSGTAKTLESALGVHTGGKATAALNAAIENLPANASLKKIDQVVGKITSPLAAASPQGQGMASLVAELKASGLVGLAKELKSQWGAAIATLSQELVAQQVTKDAESLNLQATTAKDQTQAMADYDA